MNDRHPIEIDFFQYLPDLNTRTDGTKGELFDPIRKRWIKIQPEELVRQLFIQFLLDKGIGTTGNIQVEKGLSINGMEKRFDVVVYDTNPVKPRILVECKSYKEDINQKVFDQISSYNRALQAEFLIVTNGMKTYLCNLNYDNKSIRFEKNWAPILPLGTVLL